MSYLDCGIAAIHEAYLQKKTTPLELTKESLARAKASQDNAFEKILEDEALRFAASLGEVEKDNLLWGIPYCAKDNFSTKGIETTSSSNILNDYVPLFDATVIAKLKEKKAILIGKTTMDELAMGGSGTTGHKGTTYNPFDPSHTHMIGGSSCGSAAVVASGIVPFALGSDTGDSVRRPASYAGLVGLKPTWGRISRYGLFPFAPSMDHVGFLSRSAEDAAILLEALSGFDEKDMTSSSKPVEAYSSDLEKGSFQGVRIALIKEIIDSLENEEVKRALETSLEKMKEGGAEIEEISFGKEELQAIRPVYLLLSSAEATSNCANLDGLRFGPSYRGKTYREAMMKARTAGFSELIKRRFVVGSFALSSENRETWLLRAKKARAKIVSKVNEILADHDFIYLPATLGEAPLLSSIKGDLGRVSYADSHLILGNFAGLPSIVLPFAFSHGLPVGASFMGRAFEEKKLLQIASSFESITGLSQLSTICKKEAKL